MKSRSAPLRYSIPAYLLNEAIEVSKGKVPHTERVELIKEKITLAQSKFKDLGAICMSDLLHPVLKQIDLASRDKKQLERAGIDYKRLRSWLNLALKALNRY